MLLAAGHNWRSEHGFGRWTGALTVTLVLHGGAVAAGLVTWQSENPPALPPAAIMMELAPLPVAPPAPETKAMPEPRLPEPMPMPLPQSVPEPAPELEPAPEPQVAAALPMPEIDPVPPAMREPEVVLPKPAPEKPKVAAAVEKPKEKPKDKPKPEKAKAKPQEKPPEKPRPLAKPAPERAPAVPQTAPPQPAQQAAATAAPVQQADAAAAPSAADLARRATAKANWEGLLLAHLEKHKRYPKSAKRRNQQGTCFLHIRMDRSGNVLSYELKRSSGVETLDEEVLRMIERAQPLPPLPPEMTAAVFDFVVPVAFTLH